MEYTPLKEIYYKNLQHYHSLYKERFESPYTHHIDFKIGDSPAFFVVTPAIQSKMLKIQKADKRVFSIQKDLPQQAIAQFSVRCLIDEIVLTNNIEGVHSTRREIDGILSDLERHDTRTRFRGLVQKYLLLQNNEKLSIKTCQDIRHIYNDLALKEVLQDNPNNMPDGKIFRKDAVSVQSPTQKEIHRGVYPEEKIIETMEQALAYLNNDTEELLYRTAVFHYLLGYIHPFYDGNGRLNRFISSYMLTQELEPVLSYRLSYTIKQNIEKYYAAFKICNHKLNKGDLTPFVDMFLDIIEKSITLLEAALEKRRAKMQHYLEHIQNLPHADNSVIGSLYNYLIQAELFSEHGISTKDLLICLDLSRETLRKKLELVGSAGLLKVEKLKNEKYYGIDLIKLDSLIDQHVTN